MKLFVMILFIFSTTLACLAQTAIDKELKMILFSSAESDGPVIWKDWDTWISLSTNHFDFLEVEATDTVFFIRPRSIDSIWDSYNIRLFKIVDKNSENQSRYLLRFIDFHSTVWLRVGGYVENDINLLFDYLRKGRIRKRHLRKIVQQWEGSDALFEELNLTCLLKGYLGRNTSGSCFKSVTYIRHNDSSVGWNPLTKSELNSSFARCPIYGYFYRFR